MFQWFKNYRKQRILKRYGNPTNIKNVIKEIFGLSANDTETRREQYEDSRIKFEYQRNSDDSGYVKVYTKKEDDTWSLVMQRSLDRWDHVTVDKFIVGNWIIQLFELRYNGIPTTEMQEAKPKLSLPTRDKLDDIE